ncbi:hypothetical protein PGIGA_G00197650 [Pangasianodon gigas]|uniref:Uncharacterized protein n=1 Tax=Pangasianodon gigas TaxID=30993 RepID=A0ACC5WDM7_PANGG|nr:hypothetical protein [Pangasianodon gigas]
MSTSSRTSSCMTQCLPLQAVRWTASPQLELLMSGVDLRKAMRSGGQIPPNNLPDPFLIFWYDPCQNISPWQSGKQRSEASVNNTENVRRKPVITTSCWH